MRRNFYVLTALALAGVWIADLLIVAHVDALYGSGADTGLCGGEGFSCADAARSEFSSILGLPIAALGQAYYLTVILLAGLQRFKPNALAGVPDVLLTSSALGLGYSVFLGVVSVVSVGKLCPLCVGLYAVNLGLFLAALIGHPERAGFFGRLPTLITRNGVWVAAVLVGSLTIATQGLYAHRAAEAAAVAAHKKAPDQPAHFEVDTGTAPGRGPADAPVVIVEYSDFECPYCQRLSSALAEAAKARPDLVRYHFRHYPMDDACNPNIERPFHKDACRAAVASVCAQRQGRFWELHDKMFENNKALTHDDLVGYAKSLGLDLEAFTTCLDDPAAVEQIQDDIKAADALTVQGTPTWFINGWRYVGARSPEQIIGIIEERAKAPASK